MWRARGGGPRQRTVKTRGGDGERHLVSGLETLDGSRAAGAGCFTEVGVFPREERRESFERAMRSKEDTYPASKLGDVGKGGEKRNHHPLRGQEKERGAGGRSSGTAWHQSEKIKNRRGR